MTKKLYNIVKCIRLGEMPLYLLFYQDKYGRQTHSVMLCTLKNLRVLSRLRHGFESPEQYGHVLFSGHSDTPSEAMVALLKSRYDFDWENNEESDARGVF